MVWLWHLKNGAVSKKAIETTVIKTKRQYSSKTEGCLFKSQKNQIVFYSIWPDFGILG